MANELPAYTSWLRKQPCCVCGGPPPCEVNHHTHGDTVAPGERPRKDLPTAKRGKSQRAHDWFSMPMHTRCHANMHALRGFFSGFTGTELRAWQDKQVELHRARYEAELAANGEPLPTVDEAGKALGIDILAGGSTDPRELAEHIAGIHGLDDQVRHDVERALRHVQKAARA